MIDKMYLMFPTYNLENGKLIYESYNTDLKESEQTKGSLQNRLIELYKSVLLNENVIGEVMTPVDFDHFKKDSAYKDAILYGGMLILKKNPFHKLYHHLFLFYYHQYFLQLIFQACDNPT